MEGELRNIPSSQYSQAVHTLSYFRALSVQRLWELQQEPNLKVEAETLWKSYLENTAQALPVDQNFTWVTKAKKNYEAMSALQAQRPSKATTF